MTVVLDADSDAGRRAVADIPDGAVVLIGGFGMAGMPVELIDRRAAPTGAGDLTVVSNNAGNGDHAGRPPRRRRVRKMVCSFPRQTDSYVFDALYRAGEIELEVVPQGTLVERIRAAGAGIGAFFSPTGCRRLWPRARRTRDQRAYLRAGAHSR